MCPTADSMFSSAIQVAEDMPPEQTQEIWAGCVNDVGILCEGCPGPTPRTVSIEINLPYHFVKKLLGRSATEMIEVQVYDCLRKPYDPAATKKRWISRLFLPSSATLSQS